MRRIRPILVGLAAVRALATVIRPDLVGETVGIASGTVVTVGVVLLTTVAI